MSAYPSYTRIFVLPQPALAAPAPHSFASAPHRASAARSFAPAVVPARGVAPPRAFEPAQVSSEEPMPTWFKRQSAVVDAVVAGGATFAMSGWFAEVLHGSGLLAVWVAVFGLFQLLRFVNAQVGELQWVRMHEALLREKKEKPATPAAQHDGYREAAVIEELPSADEARLEEEVPRRRRRARVSLGVAGAAVWLLTLIPGFAFGVWQVAGAATVIAALMALFFATMLAMRAKQRERSRRDYFIQHLDRDTKAMLEPKPRVRVETENASLRAGVDFGVPAEELADEDEEEEAAKRSAR